MASTASETKWYSYTSSTQTMRTWSEVLRSYQDVPAEFQAAFPEPEAAFPYTVFIPEDRLSLFQKRNVKLIYMYDDRVGMLEVLRDRVKTAVYPFQKILYLEQGRILRYSWITIVSPFGSSTATFNTVNLQQFEPIIEMIRQETTRVQAEDGQAEQAPRDLTKFDYLKTLNFKFMNYGRQSVQPGDTVLKIVYQPDRCLKTFMLFHKTLFRRYATGHLSILTEKELILIKESKRTKMKRKALYGGVFIYIPLQQIKAISFLTDTEKSRCIMDITLADNIHLRSEFAIDNPDLRAFKRGF
jgi:hypothetical protein